MATPPPRFRVDLVPCLWVERRRWLARLPGRPHPAVPGLVCVRATTEGPSAAQPDHCILRVFYARRLAHPGG